MKKLREILEATVIPFRNSHHAPPASKNPNTVTHKEVTSKIEEFTKPTGEWYHPKLMPNNLDKTTASSPLHPLIHISDHLRIDPTKLYGDNVEAIQNHNEKKKLATQLYLHDKSNIDSHVNTVLGSLQSYRNSIANHQFPTESQRLVSMKDLDTNIRNWQKVQQTFGNVKS